MYVSPHTQVNHFFCKFSTDERSALLELAVDMATAKPADASTAAQAGSKAGT
jgi:hypothetical protein